MTPQCILSVAISNYPKDEKHSFKSCWVFFKKGKKKAITIVSRVT